MIPSSLPARGWPPSQQGPDYIGHCFLPLQTGRSLCDDRYFSPFHLCNKVHWHALLFLWTLTFSLIAVRYALNAIRSFIHSFFHPSKQIFIEHLLFARHRDWQWRYNSKQKQTQSLTSWILVRRNDINHIIKQIKVAGAVSWWSIGDMAEEVNLSGSNTALNKKKPLTVVTTFGLWKGHSAFWTG